MRTPQDTELATRDTGDEEEAMRLENKVALITGGGNGNGKAMALGFAREGADVVVADLDLEAAQGVVEEIEELGRRGLAVQVNVVDRELVAGMVEEAYGAFGRVDVLVNNAGVIGRDPFLEVTEGEWDRIMDVNLKGPFLCSQAVAKRMIEGEQGGSIINITSIMTDRTSATTVPYCTSKGGVRTLTYGLAVALGEHGIRANAIAPCIVWTDMSDALLSKDSVREAIKGKIPLNEIATPKDLVGAAIFLASDESSYISGSTISINGGMAALM